MLARFKARNLPLLCPNPDRTVQFGDRVIYCAGAIAEAYENIGGEVVWVGKPYPMVYARARAMLRDMTGLENPRLLAIGDGPKTDMPGLKRRALMRCSLAAVWPAHRVLILKTPKPLPPFWPKKTRKRAMPCAILSGKAARPKLRS